METLLSRAAYKSKREIEELVAELAPKPDVQATMRKMPERRKKAKQKRTELFPERVERVVTPALENPATVEPLAPARFKIVFTASAGLRDNPALKALPEARYLK